MGYFQQRKIGECRVRHGEGLAEVPGYFGRYLVSQQGKVYKRRVYAIHTRNGWERRVKKKQLMPFMVNGCVSVCLSHGGNSRNHTINSLMRSAWGVNTSKKTQIQ